MFCSRSLLVIGACLGLALALSSQASADDGHGQPPAAPIPPRAAPVARGFVPSSYAPSFSKLIDQAVAAAADLTKASRQAQAVAAQTAAVDAVLTEIGTDVEATGSVRDRKERAVLAAAARLVDEQDAFTQAGVWSLPSADAHWSMPVSGGEISQPFGPTRLGLEPARTFDGVAYAHFHDGVDIAAQFGTPVAAAAPGQVIFAGHLADGAMVVMIAHVGGYVSEYAHLDDHTALPVRAGDIVRQGQVIGRIGLTGLTTGAHLHFEAWHGGVLTDPLTFMGARQP
jgi:murein DD-endopeptidase MepM/ murein hydrolase activator NlpD